MARHFHFLACLVLASVSLQASAESGTAGYSNPPYLPSASNVHEVVNLIIAAVSDTLWDNGRVCGTVYQVQCSGAANEAPNPCRNGIVHATITDYCPSGCAATMMLSWEAFNIIADPTARIVQISTCNYCSYLDSHVRPAHLATAVFAKGI